MRPVTDGRPGGGGGEEEGGGGGGGWPHHNNAFGNVHVTTGLAPPPRQDRGRSYVRFSRSVQAPYVPQKDDTQLLAMDLLVAFASLLIQQYSYMTNHARTAGSLKTVAVTVVQLLEP